MTTITDRTFAEGDLISQTLALTRFVNCTFQGTARNCIFEVSEFVGCTFDPAFAMVDCQTKGATGLPERFPAPPIDGPHDPILLPGEGV